jgi:hypothetical protein
MKDSRHTSNFWFGKKALEGQELVAGDVHLVAFLEAARDHAFTHFDGEVNFVDGTQDLVHLANDRLVLKINGRVEVGDFVRHERRAEHLILDSMHERAHLCSRVSESSR